MASLSIRRAVEADTPALSRICLLTADGGKTAEHLHDFKEMPGLVYAVPYVKLPTTWGFVLVDNKDGQGAVVGYILGSKDTRAYEEYASKHWWPALAEKYPPSSAIKPADVKYANLLRNMHTASDACIRFAAAHLHIDILEEYQGKGWGRRLIETAIAYLKSEGVEGNGVWLGMDPRNLDAKAFYLKLGFGPIEDAEDNILGLHFGHF